MRRAWTSAAVLVVLVLPSSASAAWNQPVGTLDYAIAQEGSSPSFATVGDRPYVAWHEQDGSNNEIRVARLNAAGTAWEQPWTGVSATSGGINQSTTHNGSEPSLASIGGVPYVAWHEDDGGNTEIRVARLNAAGTAWEQPWTGVSATSGGINQSATQGARRVSLASVGGVPYVAWEEDDGTNREIRVARLNAAGTAWEQPSTAASATSGGINQSTAQHGNEAVVAGAGGVPYVTWFESDGTNAEIRVARLDGGTTWVQPWTGGGPTYGGVNSSTTQHGTSPTLASIDGVPFVAWEEQDPVNQEIRVARLSGATWVQPWTGQSPAYGGINAASDVYAFDPSLSQIGAVPYVAWDENVSTAPDTGSEIRVARLVGGSTWQQPVGGASPINEVPNSSVQEPSLGETGGVPFVSWQENAGASTDARVSRLEPEFSRPTAIPSSTAATLNVEVLTFGIPYPIGSQFGAALERETATSVAPAGSDRVTISQQAGGLSPATGYQFRPFAIAGVPAPRVFGPTGTFTTLAAVDAIAPVMSRYRIFPTAFPAAPRGASIAGRRRRPGARVRYNLSERATVTFRVERAAKGRRVGRRCRPQTRRNRSRRPCTRYVTLRGSFTHRGKAGANSFRFTGRLRRRKLRPSSYRLQARAVDAAGNRSPVARKRFRIVTR